MTRTKAASLLVLLLATFALSACDHCGDPIRAQGAGGLMACKGGGTSAR